jgi:uncharacterized protein (TIGR00251 family)
MRLSVIVIPRAARTRVDRVDPATLRVAVTAPPQGGQANRAVVRAVADYLDVPPSHVRIVRGQTGRHKILEITSDMRR